MIDNPSKKSEIDRCDLYIFSKS